MANKRSTPERLTRVEEGIKNVIEKVDGLVQMLNPKAEIWNNTANDVKWLKKFFWVIFIAICGLLAKAALG